MGIASLIIGILSILVGIFPGINLIMLVPALVAIVLGIIDWVKKGKAGLPKGKAIAGTICASVGLILIFVMNVFLASILALIGASAAETIDTYDYSDYDYDYDYDYYDYYNY